MILIFSTESDLITDRICHWLISEKKKFVRLNENQQITNVFFDFKKEIFEIAIENVVFNLKDFQTIYYRNGNMQFDFSCAEIDENLAKFFNNELQSISHFISYFLKTNGAIIYGNLFTTTVNKLEVLHKANALGLQTPDTFVFSEIENVKRIDFTTDYITKAISEMIPIFVENEMYLNYTKPVSLEDILEKKNIIIPSLLQRRIKSDFEIRAFFFERKIWAVATFEFSDEVDIRHSKTSEKKYIPYALPEYIETKIFQLAEQLHLNCGTIDLLKSGDKYYFLEVNPLGQFQEVSHYGKFEIEKYIADLL